MISLFSTPEFNQLAIAAAGAIFTALVHYFGIFTLPSQNGTPAPKTGHPILDEIISLVQKGVAANSPAIVALMEKMSQTK